MKRIKDSRAASFIAVAMVYMIASVAGILIYRALELPWWLSLLIADAAATVLTFAFSIIFKNASVYDPYWSVQPPVILAAYAIGGELTLLGALMLCAVLLWAVRLTANWAYTFRGLNHQDWRYTMLAERTGVFYPIINFVGIHMVPTLVVWGCTLPAAYVILTATEGNALGYAALLLSPLAVLLQGISDAEMHKYRKNRTSPFIRVGLWRHSRHPNYLGEILMWWGIGLSAVLSSPDAWYLLGGALANTLLFFAVSIPMADGRQSKKAGFAEYKRQTRMLLPIKRFR